MTVKFKCTEKCAEMEIRMNSFILVGIIGIISGILCAWADVPLSYSGKKEIDQEIKVGEISKWWGDVSESRFTKAFWLSCIGQPGTYLTMWMLGVLIAQNNSGLGTALKINTFLGAYTGLLFHATACIKPMVYQKIHNKLSEEEVKEAVNIVEKLPKIPSLISGISLFLVTTVIVTIAIFTGSLQVPKYFVLFNPIVAAIVLLGLKKAKIKIVGPLGVGFILFAIVLVVAGMNL